nr:class II fructose-bisphosphate aldolase [Desulfobulbaceae bacterium]
MAIVSMNDLLKPAFKERYGVAAFNIINDVSMLAVLKAAEELNSPVIIQVSVKTVKYWGAKMIQYMFSEMAKGVSIPATLHLDHCPYPEVIKECLNAGWNSVLYDGSSVSFTECMQKTKEIVKMAHDMGATVEGEVEAVKGVEDGIGSDDDGPIIPLEQAVQFINETGIDCFAPAIGTAHGTYKGEPVINSARVSEIIAAVKIPLVLHGGTGLSQKVFTDLINRGMAKVNISTQLKIEYADSLNKYLSAKPHEYNPIKLIDASLLGMKDMVKGFIKIFGSEGKA